MTEAEDRVEIIAERLEALLDRLLSETPGPTEIVRPQRLLHAMRYAVLGGGKRLRPIFLVETARLFGATDDGALHAAAALECVHAYSLAHDDLPDMDDDDMRRGKPSLHKAFDTATAILAGDALLTLAFGILADPATDPDPAVRAELVLLLAGAAGIGGMAGGQMLDLAAEGRFDHFDHSAEAAAEDSEGPMPLRPPPEPPAVEEMQAMKTGALFRFACEAGAILGRASPTDRKRMAEFGARVGAAFQLADDLLDLTGDAASAGKAVGKDAGRGKANRAALLGVDGARLRLSVAVDDALAMLAPFGAAGAGLAGLARAVFD